MPDSTIICIDSSEHMRNGDYFPTRMEAQMDAMMRVIRHTIRTNPENTTGILKMSGGPQMLLTLTSDRDRLLSTIQDVKIGGGLDLIRSLHIALLALRHRPEKFHQQRLVVFVGSPVHCNREELIRLGKQMRKNGVALDVINVGDHDENIPVLQGLMEAVEKDGNCRFINIPAEMGNHVDSEVARELLGNTTALAMPRDAGFDEDEFDEDMLLAIQASLADVPGSQPSEPVPMETDAVPMEVDMAGYQDVEAMTVEEQIELAMQLSLAEEREHAARREGEDKE